MALKEIKEMVEKTTLANLTAVLIVVTGLGYAIMEGNSELAAFIIGAGVTWLFDTKNS